MGPSFWFHAAGELTRGSSPESLAFNAFGRWSSGRLSLTLFGVPGSHPVAQAKPKRSGSKRIATRIFDALERAFFRRH
jgi:hypothetical protein